MQGGDGHWVGTCCSTHRDLVRAVFAHAPALLIGSASFAARSASGTASIRAVHPRAGGDRRRALHPANTDAHGSDPAVLLYHGRVDRRKGVLDLLDAVRLLLADGVAVRLLVSGIGPDVDAVGEGITSSGSTARRGPGRRAL